MNALALPRTCLTAAWLAAAGLYGAVSFPPANQLPEIPGLPDVLVRQDGTRVRTAAEWERLRKPELKALVQHYMYGELPPAPALSARVDREDPTLFGGRATLREISLRYGGPEFRPIHLMLVTPNKRSGSVPVVLGLNFCGNHTVLADPAVALPDRWMPDFCKGCTNHVATEAGRGSDAEGWAIETAIGRGYAVGTFYTGDVDPDGAGAPGGIRGRYPTPEKAATGPQAWGTVAAWAWGLHRAVDYLQTDPVIDTHRIAVFGHSRNGKAVLLAGALDDRIGLMLCHQAGCGGSAPSRGRIGESVKQINDRFPHWFADAFKDFNESPQRLPFDQHALVALCAPRPVLLSNATEDSWANPEGQFEVLRAADPVYRLLGVEGLGAAELPPVGKLLDSRLGYFIRLGRHSTTAVDWAAFLDFADRHFRRS